MKYSFDVKDVSAIDLLGNNYIQLLEENQNKGIHQLVGNAVYVCTNTIEMHEIAKKIFNGEAVDMNENETELFKASLATSINISQATPSQSYVANLQSFFENTKE